MKRSLSSAPRGLRGLLRDKAGATAVLFGFMVVGLMGTAGLTFDVGQVFVSKKEFNAATQAAAMAGANALLATNASLTTVTAAVTAWNTANPPAKIAIGSTSVAVSCNTATANLPTCNGTTSNVATVTQTASVTTHFLKAFGFPAITLTSTASAAKAGGSAIPLNVMFVLDATQSMNDTDGGCTGVPGIAHPSEVPVRDVFDPERAEEDADLDGQGGPDGLPRLGLAIQSDLAPVPDPAGHDAVLHHQHQISGRHHPGRDV